MLDRFSSCDYQCFIMCRSYVADIHDAKLLHLAQNKTRMFMVGREFDTLPQIRRIEARPKSGMARDALIKCTHIVAPQYMAGVISLLFPRLTRRGRGSRVRLHMRVIKVSSTIAAYTYVRTCILLVEMHIYREYNSLSARAMTQKSGS